MARQARKVSASGVYHIMLRGIAQQRLLCDDADNFKFLYILDKVQNEDFQVLAYCLMGNHIHLLVKTSKTDIAPMERAMKRLCLRYAQHFNTRYDRVGPVFQGRYKSQPVQSTPYFLRVLRYIHRNPVEAHIVPKMNEYQWSSYADYFEGRKGFCQVYINYALQLQPIEWLREWHEQPEQNPEALSFERKFVPDEKAIRIMTARTGHAPQELQKLPSEAQAVILKRLVGEDKLRTAQLARLTGIPRGEIKRLIL